MDDLIVVYEGIKVVIAQYKVYRRHDETLEMICDIVRADTGDYSVDDVSSERLSLLYMLASPGVLGAAYGLLVTGGSSVVQQSELSKKRFMEGRVRGRLTGVSSWNLYSLDGESLQDIINLPENLG